MSDRTEPEIVQRARREVADPYTVTQWRIMWRHVIEAYELGLQATLDRPDSSPGSAQSLPSRMAQEPPSPQRWFLESVVELVEDLKRHQATCAAESLTRPNDSYGKGRVVGKASAYAHSAELVRQFFSDRAERVGEGQNPNEQKDAQAAITALDAHRAGGVGEGCCSVGLGGPYVIPPSGPEPGFKHPWHISWLPKGYAPTPDDFVICLVAEPPGEDWGEFGLTRGDRPPLVEAICAAIEGVLRSARASTPDGKS